MAKPGTSGFTHQDDAVAPIHTTNPDHTAAHIFGGLPPEEERDSVVIGPPAFGSPDVRTLGHSVNPDQNAPSAPKLDPHFEAITNTQNVYTEDELNEMSKAELYELAQNAGVDVNKSMSKNDIIDAIADETDMTDEEESGEEESGDPNNPDAQKSTKTEATRAEASAASQQQGAKTNN